MNPFTIPTRFTAVDGVSPAVRTMGRNINDMVNQANVGIARQERLFRKLTPGLSSATKQLLSYASAGVLFAGAAFSGKAILDYETAIQSLSAVTGVRGKDLQNFKGEINSLATDTQKSATDIAGSFEVVGSMMSQYLKDPKALRQITDAGITLAKASRQELVPTLQNLTSIMNQFDLKANQANETINRLTAGEIVGSLRTDQVAKSLQDFGAGAFSANVSLAESVALVEALAKQRPTENIGIDARNILNVMDAAKGLDKHARKALKHAGVDLGFLMDKTKSLSERLHELSKINGNAVAITKVFGERNKIAAQVIFNQLGVYDQYVTEIQRTNQAQEQAITNSNTLAQSIDQLKNKWINYITTSDNTAEGMNKVKDAIQFVKNNMDGIVSTGINVVKFFALWKAGIIAAKVVTTGLNISLGIQNALQLQNIAAVEGNIIAKKASIITERIMAAGIAVTTGNLTAFNAALGMTPFGWAMIGIGALAGGLYLLAKREDDLIKKYKEQIELRAVKVINEETDAVKKLVAQYWHLGQGIKEATVNGIKFRKAGIDAQRQQAEREISSLKSQLQAEKEKLYFADLFYGGGTPEVGKRAELAEKLYAKQQVASDLAFRSVGNAQFAKSQVDAGTIKTTDLGGIFNSPKTPYSTSTSWGDQMATKEENDDFRFYEKPKGKAGGEDMRELIRLLSKKENQKLVVEFKNAPAGTTVSNAGGNVTTPNSY